MLDNFLYGLPGRKEDPASYSGCGTAHWGIYPCGDSSGNDGDWITGTVSYACWSVVPFFSRGEDWRGAQEFSRTYNDNNNTAEKLRDRDGGSIPKELVGMETPMDGSRNRSTQYAGYSAA